MRLEPKLRMLQSRSRSNHSLPKLLEPSTVTADQESKKIDSSGNNFVRRRYTFTAKDTPATDPQREIIRQRFATRRLSNKNDQLQCPSIPQANRRKSSVGNSVLVKQNYNESPNRRPSIRSHANEKSTQSALPGLNQLHLVQQAQYYNDNHSVCSYDAEDEYDSHNDNDSISDSSSVYQCLTKKNLKLIPKSSQAITTTTTNEGQKQKLEMGYDSGINEITNLPSSSSKGKLKRRKKKSNDSHQQCDQMTTRIMNWLNDCHEKEQEGQLPILFQSQLTNYRC
ncbi:hypothetical protein TrispH2_003682 [Trichoplax sp. H2]|uniref:Uncharacterized protein n=1 Tax=Trichoplax adhaerens TaxID=10228 RepID=B3S411_TRIAD|nr:predicted protein [Trichoplax adhaerens]EDV22377.1 predicted protein [Trichoplax adhaerens]RDD43698.1 hypothetical protein TrispH2_003682 [Trichoplax sp. H2]|eukprot:XP_002114921.1 predicted protein [Trichoplax adhaerens]